VTKKQTWVFLVILSEVNRIKRGMGVNSSAKNILAVPVAAKSKNYSMQYSHVVSHHSTNCTSTSLTSGIRRDPVFSGVYGRSWRGSKAREVFLKAKLSIFFRPGGARKSRARSRVTWRKKPS
jgi:hypothetical protein